MHQQYNTNFPDDFPQDFIDSAYSLLPMKIEAYVWKYKNIQEVIHFLVDKEYIIIGIDVYTKIADKMVLTYDNWYLEENVLAKLTNEFDNDEIKYTLDTSKMKAINYIMNYYKRNGDNYYYALIFGELKSYTLLS